MKRTTPVEPIAIVGMACRLPGAPTLDAFWQLLREGRDGTGDVPTDRWDAEAVYDPDGGIKALWPIFGIANQLLAGTALCLATTVILKMALSSGAPRSGAARPGTPPRAEPELGASVQGPAHRWSWPWTEAASSGRSRPGWGQPPGPARCSRSRRCAASLRSQ